MTEFEIIEQYFNKPDFTATDEVVVGIGDDAAVLSLPAGQQLVLCMDTLVAGRHFHHDADAADIGWKALAVNLSDLAAMGAKPFSFQLALTLSEFDEQWLAGFSKGLRSCAEQFDCPLVGGDTTRGPLTISIQACGLVPKGEALRRSGAKAGDGIWVSGPLGAAAAALASWPDGSAAWRQALYRPQPQLRLGEQLRGVASSCIDISDGLLADLEHVLAASQVGAELQLNQLPIASGLAAAGLDSWQLACNGGDDYQLLFTLPARAERKMQAWLSENAPAACRIGIIQASQELTIVDNKDQQVHLPTAGYRHF